MKINYFVSRTMGRGVAQCAAGILLLTGLAALPASALVDPIPVARQAVRQKINRDKPARRDIQFGRTQVRRGSGHTRFVSGGGTFRAKRGIRHFTYRVNVDTSNGAVNGVNYSVR